MDVIMQMATQSLAHRLVQYWGQREDLAQVFPSPDFAEAAEEVAPFTNDEGPCLVRFHNVQVTPQLFTTWMKECFVGRHCTRVFWLQRCVQPAASREELVQAVLAAGAPPGLTGVRLDVFPKALELQIGDELYDAGYPSPMHPTQHSHLLQVVQMGSAFHWSYMQQELVWKNPADVPARFNKSVATAINKLAEVMHVLGLRDVSAKAGQVLLSPEQQQQQQQQQHTDQQQQQQQQQSEFEQQPGQDQEQPQLRWAIDIGACPGGWTTYLADSCGYNVIAVDPADLHPDVTAKPGVTHIKGKAQDVGEQVDALLRGRLADLLVCDMNDHPKRAGDWMLPLLSKLKPGGWLILTLKFYGRGREKFTIVHDLDRQFQGQLESGKVVWLLANKICERTFAARKAGASARVVAT